MYVGIPEASPLDFCVFSRLDLLIANHFPKVSRIRILLCNFWVFQDTSPPQENLPESPLRADSYTTLRSSDSSIYTTRALDIATSNLALPLPWLPRLALRSEPYVSCSSLGSCSSTSQSYVDVLLLVHQGFLWLETCATFRRQIRHRG